MNKNEKGFAHAGIIVTFIVIIVIGVCGWLVYKKQSSQDTAKTTNTIKNNTNNTADKKSNVELKTYSNADYGVSFEYPADWTLTEDLKDIGRDALEGEVAVVSPHKTTVVFDLNLGGKGGDCIDDAANIRTTRTCTTVEFLSAEKLSQTSGTQVLYLHKVKVTAPEDSGGKVTYRYHLDNAQTESGSDLWPVFVTLLRGNYGYAEISYSGGDDNKNSTAAFFDTTEAKEVAQILKTVKVEAEKEL